MMTIRDMMPWGKNRMMQLGHYGTRTIMWIAIAAGVAYNAYSIPAQPPYTLQVLSSLAGAVWLWAMFCDFQIHSRHLCERCAAYAPLNPQNAVKRWRLALRLTHSMMNRKRMIAAMAVLIAWAVFTFFLPERYPWWADVADIVIQLFIGLFITAVSQHVRLQPWCPWCHWGDGGAEETVPDPDPAVAL